MEKSDDASIVIIILQKSELVEFPSVRVIKPNLLLLNGEKFPPDKLAPSTIAIETFI
jgi:hypothetical protein